MSEQREDDSARRAIEAFLSQPALRADEDDESAPREVAPSVKWPAASRRARITSFLFEKRPSSSSNLAIRTSDGRRTRIFPFNGNGRGR